MSRRQRTLTALGQRIDDACREAGIAPTAAGERAGFGAGNLTRIMHGERGAASGNINAERFAALARLLNVSFEWLCLGTGPRKPVAAETLEAVRGALADLLDEARSERVVSRQKPHERKKS